MFGGGGKLKATAETSSGTGYGGAGDDTKRLVAGRKKAEKASNKDDKANLRYLKKIAKQLAKLRKGGAKTRRSGGSDLNDEDKNKVSSLLAEIFRNQVPADWDERKELYEVALEICWTFSVDERFGSIFGDKEDQEGMLFWLLDFKKQAEQIIKHDADLDENDVVLAKQVVEVAIAAVEMSRKCVSSKPVAALSVISLSERYQSSLGPLRFDSVESMQNHYFLRRVPTAPPSLNARALFKEMAAYRTALPVEYGSSCFCRVINSRLDMLRVMITGPDETPYANGCFFFDVQLPATYPRVAPKVQFLTTGGGKFRFNPNLYNCGKVCLSLLGTWSGPGWISGQSTLLQVLISIQSLILVPDPYFNEPGWERERGTSRGETNSNHYNKKIRCYTISAAIESHLTAILGNKNQYIEFESAMIKHFMEKSFLIQKELWKWVKDHRILAPQVSKICELLAQLANRERGQARSKRSRGVSAVAKKADKSNEPIVLDDSDVEEVYEPSSKKAFNKPLKSDETIEIDLSDSEEKNDKKTNGNAKSTHCKTDGDGDLVDLTF